jgi:hypothetical protein
VPGTTQRLSRAALFAFATGLAASGCQQSSPAPAPVVAPTPPAVNPLPPPPEPIPAPPNPVPMATDQTVHQATPPDDQGAPSGVYGMPPPSVRPPIPVQPSRPNPNLPAPRYGAPSPPPAS